MVDLTAYKNKISTVNLPSSNDPRSDFLNELLRVGFTPPKILKDGVIDRISDPLDKGHKQSGWYIYNQYENISIGVYGSWRGDPEKIVWSSKNINDMSFKQKIEFNKHIKEADEKRKAETLQKQSATAQNVLSKWQSFPDATKENPYINKKKIKVFDGIKANGEILIIPITINEKITSIQRIYPDSNKRFELGGRVKGCYYKLKGNDDSVIYIAEGYATGASICEATGNSVYIAFSAGNMYEVASKVKSDYPNSKIIIAGENNDANITKANQISQGLMIDAIFPPKKYDDFNDMHVDKGLKSIKDTLTIEVKPYIEPKNNKQSNDQIKFTGVIGEIINYYNATSGNNQPLFAIQSAMATCSVILGRNFTTNFSNRTALFLMNIAKSGTGKEHAKNVLEKILEKTDNGYLIAGDGYTSGAAVISALQERPRHVTVIDEFSKYLKAAQQQGSSHLQEANTQLMQAISRLDGTMRAKSYATIGLSKEKKKELASQFVINPHITLMSMTTPDDLFNTIDISSIKDGFLNRFIICLSDEKRSLRENKEPIDIPQSIIDWDLSIKERRGDTIETAMDEPSTITIPFSIDAITIQREFQQYCIEQADALDAFGMDEIPNRSGEMAMRLALIIALSDNPMIKQINKQHMEKSIEWVKFNLDRLIDKLKMSVSGSEFEGNKKEILQGLRDKKAKGITWSKMQKTSPFSKYKPKDLKEILQALKDSELAIEAPAQATGKGRPSMLWVAIN